MAYNGSGVWNRLYNWTNDAANGIKIRADRMDAEFNDMCNNGLSAVLTRDGQGKPSAALPMNGFNHTGAANATGTGQYLVYGQPQVNVFGAVSAAFGTTGVGLIGNAFTQTDSVTAAGTVATAYASTLGAATFATGTNSITITNAYGLYLADPVAGAHVTLTNKYALGVDSLRCVNNLSVGGTLAVTGHVTLEGVTSTGATGTGNLVFSAAPTFTGTAAFANVTASGTLSVTGHTTFEGVTSTGATGTGKLVYSISPTFTGTLAAATMTASGGLTTGTGITVQTGNVAITAGNVAGPGYTLTADGGSGGNCTVTGFGNNTVYSWNGLTATANWQVVCGGSGGVILNNGATSWSAISDYRSKDIFGPFTDSGAIIDNVPVYLAAMKDRPEIRKAMFLAHELQGQMPHAVHGEKDGEAMQVVETTDPLIPVMWAQIQELRARLAAAEAKS